MTYIKCKFKTEAMGTKALPVIFQPELNLCVDLVITEKLVGVNSTKTKARLKSPFTTRPVRRLGLRTKRYLDI